MRKSTLFNSIKPIWIPAHASFFAVPAPSWRTFQKKKPCFFLRHLDFKSGRHEFLRKSTTLSFNQSNLPLRNVFRAPVRCAATARDSLRCIPYECRHDFNRPHASRRCVHAAAAAAERGRRPMSEKGVLRHSRLKCCRSPSSLCHMPARSARSRRHARRHR